MSNTYKNEYIVDVEYQVRSGAYRAWVTESRACNLINARLNKYPGADFEKYGCEGIFDVQEKDLAFVKAIMLKYPNRWGK